MEEEYPTKEELEFIALYRFNHDKGFLPLVEHILRLWHWSDYAKWDGKNLELHTGGWSGNEDIINALTDTPFWMFYWKKSERGGHYYFEVKQ